MAAVDMFLKLDGVLGESADAKNSFEMQIDSFRLQAESPRDASHTNLATGAGRMSPLTIRAKVEKATSKLFEKAVRNLPINKATLTCRKAGTTPLDYLIVELTDVIVVRVQIGELEPEQGDVIPPCEFDLSYGKVSIKTQGQTSTGTGTGVVQFDFDLRANQ
ncbi:MAG: Hcp family type VI secretion system effector [Candidatus Aminicenantales bacterium]